MDGGNIHLHMATATDSYTSRILGLLGEQPFFSVLEATPAKLRQHFDRLGPQGLKKSYAPGKWTAAQILCHLADAELAIGFRSRQAAVEPNHRIQPFDQDQWAQNYARQDAAAALNSVVALRQWNLSFWRTLAAEDLRRVAFHPERGDESVETILKLLAGHDLNHLAQLEKIA
jgi:DinB superfamily